MVLPVWWNDFLVVSSFVLAVTKVIARIHDTHLEVLMMSHKMTKIYDPCRRCRVLPRSYKLRYFFLAEKGVFLRSNVNHAIGVQIEVIRFYSFGFLSLRFCHMIQFGRLSQIS